MSAQEVSSNIDMVTMKSRELQVPAKSLTVVDGPLLAVGQGNFPVRSALDSDQCVANRGEAHRPGIQGYRQYRLDLHQRDVAEQPEILWRRCRRHLQLLPHSECGLSLRDTPIETF